MAAPRYFDKAIQLGGLMQISSAFRQVQESLSFIISSYTEIAEYQSVVQRLAGFREKMNEIAAEQQRPQPIEIERGGTGVEVDALDLNLPDGRVAAAGHHAGGDPGQAAADHRRLPGSGKSTLLRAIAGLWPFGRGRIRVADGACLFLPQRPYLPLGTLADALVYPRAAAELPRDEPRRGAARRRPAATRSTGSTRRATGRSACRSASSSGSAFARVLLARPEIVFLDEATSALDEAAEMSLYRLLREAPWRPTIVSVGHHGTLRRFHDTVVDLARGPVSRAAVG